SRDRRVAGLPGAKIPVQGAQDSKPVDRPRSKNFTFVTCNVARQKEIVMGNRFSGLIVTAAIAGVAGAAVSVSVTRTSAQGPAVSGAALKTSPLKTAWGEPDLQGIWTDEFDTPLQRPSKYANQEFFTEAQRAELDQVRGGILNRRATVRDANN